MKKWCLIVIVIFIGLVTWGGIYIYKILYHGELANKPIYAGLQGFAEKKEYNSPFTLDKNITPIFVKHAIKYRKQTYDTLGIPTRDERFPYFWIITNTHVDNDASVPERVLYLSTGTKYYLPCDYLKSLEKEESIDKVVKDFLMARCIKE